jgi:hypothetical protein
MRNTYAGSYSTLIMGTNLFSANVYNTTRYPTAKLPAALGCEVYTGLAWRNSYTDIIVSLSNSVASHEKYIRRFLFHT